MRFSADAASDHEVRLMLDQPSIDCILTRRRLIYLQRLIKRAPRAHIALLAVRAGDRSLPWAECIRRDLELLFDRVLRERGMGSPTPNLWGAWPEWIVSLGAGWKEVVSMLHFTESILDERASMRERPATRHQTTA